MYWICWCHRDRGGVERTAVAQVSDDPGPADKAHAIDRGAPSPP